MRDNQDKIRSVGKTTAPYAQAVKIKTETPTGALKTVIVVLILLAQLGGFIYLSMYFAYVATWAFALFIAFSIITCIAVLSSNKNSLSKAVWIIFILVCFTFGYVLYIISDERLFFRKSKKRYEEVFSNSKDFIPNSSATPLNSAVKNDARYLLSRGDFPAYKNSSLEYYSSGTVFFDDVIDEIRRAEKFVFIEFFIVADGLLFNRVTDVLKERAKAGVDVRIIYDDMGSHKTLSLKSKNALKSAGIKITPFNRLLPIFSISHNVRDHRKIVVIDGKIAYTGGCNLADEYVNEKRMHGYWKDCGVKANGEVVDSFTITFLRQWEFLTKKPENYKEFLGLFMKHDSNSTSIFYADGLDYDDHIAKTVYENIISSAHEKILIMTPYFIIDDTIFELLANKATSGVEVSLILPEIPDKKYAYGITRSNAEKLIDYGVNVYVMKNSFVHGKVVISENCAVVGSVNMDFRSFYQQFECALYSDDKSFMQKVEKDYKNTLEVCERITNKTKFRRNYFYRIYAGLMQLFAPFM